MPEPRVLVVENDASARDLLVGILDDDGYQVCAVTDSPAAVETARTFHPDLALIAARIDGGHGDDVARGLRQAGNVPIIFVTAARSPEDIHSGFEIGADDYIVKPFDPEELLARVRAVMRRSGHGVAQVWECGDLVVDDGVHRVTRAGHVVALTATEFNVLRVLVNNRTRMVPTSQLLGRVWGSDDISARHTLEVHMSSLRRKLEAHGSRMIQTVRGTGYILQP